MNIEEIQSQISHIKDNILSPLLKEIQSAQKTNIETEAIEATEDSLAEEAENLDTAEEAVETAMYELEKAV